MSELEGYLVVVDGSGESGDDFDVQVRRGHDAKDALERSIADGFGNSRAYVVPLVLVDIFDIGEQTMKTTEHVDFRTAVERTPRGLRKFLDRDNITGFAVESPQHRRRTPPGMKRPHPIQAWRDMGDSDSAMLRDYEPGAWAPLDMPIGLQGMTIFIGGMILFLLALIGMALWEWLA